MEEEWAGLGTGKPPGDQLELGTTIGSSTPINEPAATEAKKEEEEAPPSFGMLMVRSHCVEMTPPDAGGQEEHDDDDDDDKDGIGLICHSASSPTAAPPTELSNSSAPLLRCAVEQVRFPDREIVPWSSGC